MDSQIGTELTNYYEILDLSPQATESEIYEAYRTQKGAYSTTNPEIFQTFTIDEIQQLLILIEEAFATLGHPRARELYNEELFHHYPHLQKMALESMEFVETEAAEGLDLKTSLQELPQGQARTQLSVYTVDDHFEALIQTQDFFDGQFLSKIRKYKRVSLEDLSQHTCINTKYLRAIESNNYKALPARVFTKGYVQQYCRVLTLPEERVVSSFLTLFDDARAPQLDSSK